MGIASGIVVYIVLWWSVFFMTLPWGAGSPHEAGEEVEPGFAASAPKRPRLGLKAAITTVIAAALWGVAYWVIANDLISFREGAGQG